MRFELTLLSIVWILFDDSEAKGYCSFPTFLWAPMPDGSERKWIGKTEFFRRSGDWDSQQEIIARETELIIRQKVQMPCDIHQRRSGQHCYRLQTVHEVICVSEEAGDKYRVQQRTDDSATFTCLRFMQRGSSVVQLYQATHLEINQDRLCHDESLQRQDWIWIGEQSPSWHYCPVVGGFDFGLYEGDKKTRLCPDVWRPSRLESECIRGEGLNFYFPEKQCTPFKDKVVGENRFYCFASWTEGQYLYILFGKLKDFPRYTLRLPTNIDVHDESIAYLYFSPTAPYDSTGKPSSRIYYAELKLLRSEPGVCFDESDQCRQFVAEGKCTNQALHHYANFCKKSCGLCDFAPSSRSECKYPENFSGDWVMFTANSREEITIEPGAMRFSTLGTFVCKSKHWEFDYYKSLSVYTNGCRPRYSCIHLYKGGGTGETISFQLSRSTLSDESFSLCLFMDDPDPLGDRIRSAQTKILLPMSSMFLGSCGLGGIVEVQAVFADGTTCFGEMYDVNKYTCDARSSLFLELLSNCNHKISNDYICSAFSRLPTGSSFLVAGHREGDQDYTCFVVDMYSDLNAPKGHLGTYKAARCDTGFRLHQAPSKDTIMELSLNKDYEKPCGRIQDEARYHIESPNVFKPPIENIAHVIQKTESVKTSTKLDIHNDQLPKSRTRKEEESLEMDAHSLTESSSLASKNCAKYNQQWVLLSVTASLVTLTVSHRHSVLVMDYAS